MGREPQTPEANGDEASVTEEAGAPTPPRTRVAAWLERVLWGADPADETVSAQHPGDAAQLPPAAARRRRDAVKARRRRDLFSAGRAFFSFGCGGDGPGD